MERWAVKEETRVFTGIVEELGEVVAREPLAGAARLRVRGPLVTADAAPGSSIAVNGVCLTVVDVGGGEFSADVMAETLERSALGTLAAGERVNLERPLAPTSRLGGHLVQGHVDGTAAILDRSPAEHWELVRIALPAGLARYVAEKGSIAVDGVSLTVVHVGAEVGPEVGPEVGTDVGGDWFSVGLIPTTLALTTLGRRQPGDTVNLEVDVIAKYVERLLPGAPR